MLAHICSHYFMFVNDFLLVEFCDMWSHLTSFRFLGPCSQ